ncbi:MAG: nitrilase-related carbon-nitrogen hydrolase, partial [Mariprofundaceae bacterium]|nr:nitrilase-related carbon-nitrogen hydrolase [Mariprofundaceae bacterium]
ARLSAEAAERADIIIWPEVAVPLFLERNPGWRTWLMAQMRSWDKVVLFGGLKTGSEPSAGAEGSIHNGLFLFQPGQPGLQFVGKKHLVPFGEYVPEWIPYLHTVVPNIGNFRPTRDQGVLLPVAAAAADWQSSFGALICYEALFPEEARQRARSASVLVNVTMMHGTAHPLPVGSICRLRACVLWKPGAGCCARPIPGYRR